jgi:DNA-binding FadR family transcriptional regulator
MSRSARLAALEAIEPVGHTSLRVRVSDQLQSHILEGRFAPGEALPPERDLAAALGVSRTVIRDALRMLATRGLIDVRHGQPTIVAPSSRRALSSAIAVELLRADASMRDLIEARKVFELGIAVAAAKSAQEIDFSDLDKALARFVTAEKTRQWSLTDAAHLDVHLAIGRLSRNRALDVLLVPLSEVIVTTSLHPRLDEPEIWDLVWDVPVHEMIVRALKSGSVEQAIDAIDRHFAYTEDIRYREFLEMRFSEAPDVREELIRHLEL